MKRRSIIIFVLIVLAVVTLYVFRSGGDVFVQFRENKLSEGAEEISAKTEAVSRFLGKDWRKNEADLRRDLRDLYDNLVRFSVVLADAEHNGTSTGVTKLAVASLFSDYRNFDAAYVTFFSDYVVNTDWLDFQATLEQLESVQVFFQNALAGTLLTVPQVNFRAQVTGTLFPPGYIFEEFRFAELIDTALLETNAIGLIPKYNPVVLKLKEDLILIFAGRLEGATPELRARAERYLLLTPGNLLRRLALFDEVRENVIDSDLKTRLNVVRQELLQKIGREIDRGVAEAALERANSAVRVFQEAVANRKSGVSQATKQVLERAEFHADQAEVFLSKRNYPSAFGQATAARVAAENALLPLVVSISEYQLDIEAIKARFDDIKRQIEQAGIVDQEIVNLMVAAEEQILTVARLLETEAESRKTFDTLRALKILMGGLTERAYELL
jgi:tetrahydromethanopterin S-methyltransferase subunit G